MRAGARGTIAFSHANGFPASTYERLFDVWRQAGWRVTAVERYGHEPAHPVSSNWPHLRDQLIRHIESEAPGQAVHLVGHSMGGYLSLMAACRRPELARGLVLIDSPLVAGWRAHSVRAMKLSGLFKRLGPSRVSARRRWQWPSAAAALAHFAAKTNFARWDPAVLADYIRHGTEPDPVAATATATPGAVRLAFTREIETRIYATLPHHLGLLLQRHPPRCAAAYIGGTRSAEGRQAGLAATRALVGERLQWIEGSHLFPMERPAETATAVLAQISNFPR